MSLDIVELFLEDNDMDTGIDAISIVEYPAIEEDFIALKGKEFKFQAVDEEKKILMGPLLIPNKPIYRKDDDGKEYYIYFSKETVNQASQLFLKNSKQKNSTLEHAKKLHGLTLVESWIVEDSKMDKSYKMGMEMPEGTWMGSVKVDNDQVWQEFVKTGKVKGFSIEGYFAEQGKREFKTQVIDGGRAIIDDRLAYATKEKAIETAKDLGCEGYHTHDLNGKTWYMPCRKHKNTPKEDVALETLKEIYRMLYEAKFKKPCWDGYEMVGTKRVDGKEVPNCVPIKN